MEQVNSIQEFLKKIERYENYSGVFYRGQSEKYQSITSSLCRDSGYIQNEYAIYKESIEMKSDEFDGLSAPIEYLSKMQHYGIPTRLIDLSIDPLIALFFAVQNSDCESSGNVYIYVQPKHSLGDKNVKLLALLATLDSYELESIKTFYSNQYGESISKEEILKFASDCAFIEHSEELQKLNVRLFSQQGTFAICGNFVEGECIRRTIKPLDSIAPAMLIRIPIEHKLVVKRELDLKYNINETTIYPEFPSVADYLKEKYKSNVFNTDRVYNILDTKESSNFGARRISVIVVVNRILRIEEIKQVAIEIIEQNKVKYDVVWVYIAKNGDDYIMRNWILSCQWIRLTLDPRYKPLEIGPADEDGCRWIFEKSYSALSDYYAEYAFEDDKTLYTYHMKIFKEIKPYYIDMVMAFNADDLDLLIKYTKENEKAIRRAFLKFGDFGHSRNNVFNNYIDNYQEFASNLDNVVLWVNKEGINDRARKHQISICFREARKNQELIEEHAISWKQKIGLTDSEYEKLDPYEYNIKEYKYKQTLPINPNALEVWFKLEISKNEDNTLTIKGTTNLFDKASLMISIRNSEGYLLGQSKSDVKDGNYDFGSFGRKGIGYLVGTYEANISLSLPDVQNKEFVNKAGIEYENLTGEYVDRNGIGPLVNYNEKFSI